jgi:hypothetical protein
MSGFNIIPLTIASASKKFITLAYQKIHSSKGWPGHLLFALFVIISTSATHADILSWNTNGPIDTRFFTIGVANTKPAILYALLQFE